jgi:endonuclease VIII
MPEGDTIFRAATALRKALVGARVKEFQSARLGRGPVGERIEEVSARGKNLLVRFEKGRTLRTHMMMHGSWHLYRAGERWRRPAFQARVALEADNGMVAVCFAAPIVEWLRPGSLDLGPDATADAFDPQEAVRRLQWLRGMPVEEALLTQSAMAGVGNVVKCEALFIRRVDPFAPVDSLPPETLERLVAECHRLLVRNRVHGPRTARESLGAQRMWVHGRAGQPCFVCGEEIRTQRTKRLTYFCARCQRRAVKTPSTDRGARPRV